MRSKNFQQSEINDPYTLMHHPTILKSHKKYQHNFGHKSKTNKYKPFFNQFTSIATTLIQKWRK